ncbi:hypothetical protein BZG02_20365 [Labilibaculum filiforme]|uniref:N-acetyltransferase domain-containing protein n=1 Tax=Labilibaculum filiforme TaxID=1940526 RepID=A0A2N3HQ65_9BACT|nr:GNAT family N-acetyltransferase [Labilibaculum filiforme]PKQ60193.1 hypothetical protein BZG02_20365 [Labilibaculum filiforme]
MYEEAFPEEERRELDLQQQMMRDTNYHFDIVTDNGHFVGFIFWWQFKGLRYIEHLATAIKYRGKAYGKCIVEQFISDAYEAIILEVELPNCDSSKRRIAFYQRLGFILNTQEYYQLPMRKNGVSIEMLLMTYPKEITASQLSVFKENFREMCYAPYFE